MDRLASFERLCLDYALGNCDNHLKNRALLYDAQWTCARLAPVYDIMCTTLYPGLYREMGVSFGNESRRIDDVTPADILKTAHAMGAFPEATREILANLTGELVRAIGEEGAALEVQGFENAPSMAESIARDAEPRVEVLQQALASA